MIFYGILRKFGLEIVLSLSIFLENYEKLEDTSLLSITTNVWMFKIMNSMRGNLSDCSPAYTSWSCSSNKCLEQNFLDDFWIVQK